MDYFTWFYTRGLNYYFSSWKEYMYWLAHYFSPVILLTSLFSPWKKLIIFDKQPGFNFTRFFRDWSFNVISRLIGALVRLSLVIAGLVIITLSFLGGIAGFLIWIVIPVFGFPVYRKYINQPENIAKRLIKKAKTDPYPISVLLDNQAGRYLADHLGLEIALLMMSASAVIRFPDDFNPKTYEEIITLLVDQGVWNRDFFRSHNVDVKDVVIAAKCWDIKQASDTLIMTKTYASPSVGLNLLFGYTPVLNRYSNDLSVRQSFAHHLIGREQDVSQIERVLTAGNSVALVGQPGVGKKTVVLEFAHRALQGQFGPAMTFKKVYEFDYNALLSESKDLNEKKTLLSQVLEEASYAGNIILVIGDIYRLTNSSVEGYDFTDIFELYLGKRDLKIITILTPNEYERFVVPNLRLRKYLEKVEVLETTKEESLQITLDAAQTWESKKKLIIEIPAIRRLVEESEQYITDIPFPEKVLELLDAAIIYVEQNNKSRVTLEDALAVLAEKTGISLNKLSDPEEKILNSLEEIIHQRLVNQETAVNLIAQSLRARTIGVTKSHRPLGSFLFLGPTGVGKTETAKVLAKVYFGSEDAILRFNMAEYAGSEGVERLIGSVNNNLPGVLTTAVKNHPASLLLLDEIEKASPQIFNLFLALLDEGKMSDAFGRVVNANHLFVICTSNAGAEYVRELVNNGIKGEELQKNILDFILKKEVFSPEFINRFDGVVVYEPLTPDNLSKVALILLNDFAANLTNKGIILNISDKLVEKVATDGYEPAFGARPMRRIVELVLGDLVGKALLSKTISEGDTIDIVPLSDKDRYNVLKAP